MKPPRIIVSPDGLRVLVDPPQPCGCGRVAALFVAANGVTSCVGCPTTKQEQKP